MENALDRAKAHWDATGDIVETVAILAARLSKYQPFRETNHRTAYAVARLVAERNGYERLVRIEDEELTSILARDRDPYRSIEAQVQDISELLGRRVMLFKLSRGANATGTSPTKPISELMPEPPKPAPEIVAKQDPTHTVTDFMADLSKATRRRKPSSPD